MDKPNELIDSHTSNSNFLFNIYYATPTIFEISFPANAKAYNLEKTILKVLLTLSLKSFFF